MKKSRWKKGLVLALLLACTGTVNVRSAGHVSALEAAEQAGSPITVKQYGEEEDSSFSFRLKRTEHTTCTWKDTSGIADPQLIHQTGNGIERWGQMVTSDAQKGKISCYLTNMGSYKGKNTNLRITFTDWPSYRTESGERYYPVLGVSLSLTTDFYGLIFSDIWYLSLIHI